MNADARPDRSLEDDLARLRDFVAAHPRLFVLTGAGVSTDSGIPDYRDNQGDWKRPQPVTYQAFMAPMSWPTSAIRSSAAACSRSARISAAMVHLS